jgi:hypothetical protein
MQDASDEQPPALEQNDEKRRAALRKLAVFGAYTAPVMLALLTAPKAMAASKPHGGCCWVDSLLAGGQRVGDAQIGSPLLMLRTDDDVSYAGAVQAVRHSDQPCLYFGTASGIGATLSESTPMPIKVGGAVDFLMARDIVAGDVLAVQDENGFRWEKLTTIEQRGTLPVSLLAAGNGVYAAGDQPGRLLFTHNKIQN